MSFWSDVGGIVGSYFGGSTGGAIGSLAGNYLGGSSDDMGSVS